MIKVDKETSDGLMRKTFAPVICKMCNVSEFHYRINNILGFLYVHKEETWYLVENYEFKDCYLTTSFITK
jgi:hypothetical protein